MQKPLTAHHLSELEAFVGMQLTQCLRTYWYPEDSILEVDSVCLVFANGRSVEFYPLTETFSLKYGLDVDTASQDRMDVSGDGFWKDRIGSSVTRLKLILSDYRKEPNGIGFELSNGLHFELKYDGEDDSLIVLP